VIARWAPVLAQPHELAAAGQPPPEALPVPSLMDPFALLVIVGLLGLVLVVWALLR
jgi:hypothetical protein